MVVEKQGDMECALSTMGALAGIPLATVRQTAHSVQDELRQPFFKHRVLRQVALRLDPSGRLLNLCGGFAPSNLTASSEGSVRLLSNRIRTLPPRGRGVVRIISKQKIGHIAPWQDGLVYNPNTPTVGITLKEFRRRSGWNVDFITFESIT